MAGLTLPAGDYFIYNNVAGDKLAVTFHDVSQPLTVQKLDNGDTQRWRIDDTKVEGVKAIVPLKNDIFQACWADDQTVSACPAAKYFWIIKKIDEDYAILGGGGIAQWGLTAALPDEKITVQALNGNGPTQRWTFEKVTTQ